MIRSGRHSPAAFVLSLIFGLFLSFSFVFTPVLAATTDTISFQSKLVNADGTNITNNTYNFRFRIFSVSSGGTALWSEDRSLSVTDGVVSAQLGAVTSFGATLFDNADLYLQICFDANGTVSDSSDANCDTVSHRYEEVFSTRKPITAVPLAFRAKALTDGAGNSFGPNSFFKQGANAFGATAVLGTTDAYGLQFKTNNAVAVTILSGGNVGIGNDTPGQKLSVAGTLGIIETGTTPTYYTIFQGGDQAADITYTLPTASSNGVLTNTGGVLSWAAGGGSGDITDVGSMISGAVFADATADDDWLGLGAAAGRIEFDDQAIDEVNILDANVGIGTNAPAHKLDIAGGTLGDQKYALRVTATMPATPTAMQNGIYFDITGSGTAAQTSIATRIDYKAGYTGSSGTRALLLTNANAGTGNNLQLSVAGTSPTSNTGITAIVNPTTTGLNIGTASLAENGNLNIGLFGRATIAKNSATNIGVSGFALNTGTSPIQIGGYFGLQNATPTFESAALIADNGAQTSPIFLGRDNGSTVFGIYDGGGVDIAGHLAVGASASISTANVILVEETFNTASPISGIYSIITNTATGAVGIAPAIQGYAIAKNPYGGYFEATANDATGTARGGYFEGESGLNNTGVMAFGRSGASGATLIGGYFQGLDTYDNASAVYGLQASAYAGAAGTAVYGIYIDVDNYAANTEYAIYSPSAAKSKFGGNLITDGALVIAEAGVGGNYTYFQGGTQASDITYTLPVNAGNSGQVLSSNGSGTLSWINSGALYSSSNTVSSGSYLTVAHNQGTNDLMSSAWYYDTVASQWRTIDNAGSKTIKHALQNEWDDATTAGKIRVNTRLTNVELAPSVNTGTGVDGAITISGDKSINSSASSISGRTCTDVGGTGGDAPYYSVTALSSTTATLSSNPSNPSCLKAGDEILLINLQGGSSTTTTNVGNYETLTVSSISTNTVTFTTAKTKYYGDGAANDTNIGTGATNQKVMLQRVPNYTNVTVNSTINFYPDAYDYSTGLGGVMFFRATGTVTVSGTIHANAKGYIGGVATTDITATRATPGQSLWYTTDTAGRGGLADANSPGKDGGNGAYSGGGGGGKSLTSAGGSGGTSSSATGAGGGGAGGHAARVSGTFAGFGGGGGGGGYGTAGNGGTGNVDGGNGSGSASGAGGAAGISTYNYAGGGGGGASNYGSATLGNLFMGSGGGAGGTGQNASAVEYSGTAGGRGGGIVLIAANTVAVSGGVQSNGQQASASSNQLGACGGSGAGGSIRIEGSALSLGITKVTASGGAAQTTTCNKTGGGGGAGRIAAYYASTNSGTTAPDASSTQVAYNTYGLYHSAPISTTNAIAFEDIRWEGNLNTYGKLQVQTRSGNSTTPTDGTWEPWKPAVASTNYVSLHTANTHTLWTGTNATVAEGDVTRNIDMFEDEDEATATNVAKITSSTNGGYAGADVESVPINISGYSYITFWVRASQPGNTLKIGFGETVATEQEQNITIDATDTWQKVYWDISGITGTSRDSVAKLRITNFSTSSNTFYIDNIKAEALGSTMTGTAIASTPNNYLQYRVIFTTTNTNYPPQLENVYVNYNNGYKVVQADNNTVRLYNYTGNNQDLRLSVSTTTGVGNSSLTVGSMTGSSLFADAGADDDWLGLGASAGRIEFDDQTTDEVNILNANVGIGTSTPTSFTLQVAGHIGPDSNDTYDLGSSALRFRNLYLGGDTLYIGTSATDEATISYNTTSNILNFGTDSTTNGDIAFFTDDLFLDKSTGRVGIGNTAPSSELDITGSSYISGQLGVGDAPVSNYGANITMAGSGLVQGVRVIATTTSATASHHAYGVNITPATANAGNAYGLYLQNPTSTSGSAWGLYSLASNNYFSGSVGIGDSTPSYPLDVTGNVNVTGSIGVGSATPIAATIIGAANTFTGNAGIIGITASPVITDATLTGSRTYYGVYGNVASSLTTIGAYTQNMNAVYGRAQYTGTGTAATSRGTYGHTQNTGTGTITSAYGVYGLTDITNASGTMTSAYGLYADVNNTGSGTITTGYGVYIGDVSGTTDYGLYQVGATDVNYFAGDVGIGDTTPSSALDVNGRIRMATWTADGDAVAYRDNATSNIALVTSDRRLKKNISPLLGSLDIAMQIKPYKYNDLDEPDGSKLRLGVMSQEVLPIIPELTFSFTQAGSSETYYSVHYDKLPVLLLGAIQEQQKQIEQLQASVGATTDTGEQTYIVSAVDLPEGSLVAGSANAGSYQGQTVHTVEPLTVANLGKYLGVKQLRQNSTQPASVENPDHAVNVNTALVLVEEGLGGDIVYGDRIAISTNIPGYGVKDSTGLQASIGWATTPINWALVTDMVDGKKMAKVEVSLMVERPTATGLNANTANWLYDENSATLSTPAKVVVSEMTATIGNFNVFRTRTLNVNDLFLVDDAGNLTTSGEILATALSTPVIKGVGGLVNISLASEDLFKVTSGGASVLEASVQGVKVNNLVVTDQQAGRVVIKSGQSAITVESTLVTSESVIIATPNKPVVVAVSPQSGKFIIELAEPTSGDLEVSWYVVNTH